MRSTTEPAGSRGGNAKILGGPKKTRKRLCDQPRARAAAEPETRKFWAARKKRESGCAICDRAGRLQRRKRENFGRPEKNAKAPLRSTTEPAGSRGGNAKILGGPKKTRKRLCDQPRARAAAEPETRKFWAARKKRESGCAICDRAGRLQRRKRENFGRPEKNTKAPLRSTTEPAGSRGGNAKILGGPKKTRKRLCDQPRARAAAEPETRKFWAARKKRESGCAICDRAGRLQRRKRENFGRPEKNAKAPVRSATEPAGSRGGNAKILGGPKKTRKRLCDRRPSRPAPEAETRKFWAARKKRESGSATSPGHEPPQSRKRENFGRPEKNAKAAVRSATEPAGSRGGNAKILGGPKKTRKRLCDRRPR